MRQILLDNDPLSLEGADLPFMIHGAEKSGASLFCVVAAASLCHSGKPITFWSAYPMAKAELRKELADVSGSQSATIIDSESQEELAAMLPEISLDRMLVVKNFETLPEAVRNEVLKRDSLMIAGDLAGALTEDQLPKFRTQIFFSEFPDIHLPQLQKYQGFMLSSKKQGFVQISP